MDRNDIRIAPIDSIIESLSARRAWIEIVNDSKLDDNIRSLSARRAWIEINLQCLIDTISQRRSPQGERG